MESSDIIFEQYNPTHNDSIKRLLSLCFSNDIHSKSFFERGWKSSNKIGTYIALYKYDVIGAITTWKTKFHPNCTYMSLVIHPLYRNNGVENQLLKYVEKQDISYPLQTSVWETNYFLKNYYAESGFKEIRRTYLSLLPIKKIQDLEVSLIKEYSQTSISIKSLNEINEDESLKKKLILLAKETYEVNHRDNPPGINDLQTWEKLIFNNDTLMESSYIAISEDSDILAYALLHEGENNILEFGWRGTKSIINSNLLILLSAIQIRDAKAKGYEYIEGEIDTTDPYSIEIFKVFPFSPSPSLITYQLFR